VIKSIKEKRKDGGKSDSGLFDKVGSLLGGSKSSSSGKPKLGGGGKSGKPKLGGSSGKDSW